MSKFKLITPILMLLLLFSCTKNYTMPQPGTLDFAKLKVNEYTNDIQNFNSGIKLLRNRYKDDVDHTKALNVVDRKLLNYIKFVNEYTREVKRWEDTGVESSELDTYIVQIEYLRKDIRNDLIALGLGE